MKVNIRHKGEISGLNTTLLDKVVKSLYPQDSQAKVSVKLDPSLVAPSLFEDHNLITITSEKGDPFYLTMDNGFIKRIYTPIPSFGSSKESFLNLTNAKKQLIQSGPLYLEKRCA